MKPKGEKKRMTNLDVDKLMDEKKRRDKMIYDRKLIKKD